MVQMRICRYQPSLYLFVIVRDDGYLDYTGDCLLNHYLCYKNQEKYP